MPYDETKTVPYGEPDRNNATEISVEEVDDGTRLPGYVTLKSHYDLLNKINRGTHIRSSENQFETYTYRPQQRQTENLELFDAVSDTIDMITRRRKRAKRIFRNFNYKRYSQPNDKGNTVALLAVCTCAYVCWQDDLQTHPNHSERDERFEYVLDYLNVSDAEFTKWYGKMANELRSSGGGEGYI